MILSQSTFLPSLAHFHRPISSPPPPLQAWVACARSLCSSPSSARPTAYPSPPIPPRALGEKGARVHSVPTPVGASEPGLIWHFFRAVYGRALSTKPSVSTSRWRLLPRTFLLPSYPLCLLPTPKLLEDWESATTPALGRGSCPSGSATAGARSRKVALSRSKVPSTRHICQTTSRRSPRAF